MPYRFPNTKVLLFTKAPIAGKCKSRLIPLLGERGAANLQTCLINKIVYDLNAMQLCPFEIWESEQTNYFATLKSKFNVNVNTQAGHTLGERMHHALTVTLKDTKNAIIIGSDCAEFTEQYFMDAIDALDNNDIVIGPAHDGGYLLIGMSQAYSQMFENIEWGASNVFLESLARAQTMNLSIVQLTTLNDIDLPADLAHLPKNMSNLLP